MVGHRRGLTPRRLDSTLAIGLSFALVNTLLSIAIISLIFSGPLASALPLGIGIALAASLVDHHSAVREEPSLDHAMAWCEDRILEGLDVTAAHRHSLPDGLLECSTRIWIRE